MHREIFAFVHIREHTFAVISLNWRIISYFVLILTFNFHEPTSTDFTCEEYLSACNWWGGGTKEGGGSRFRFERKQGEKSNVVEKGTREGQSSQSLGHSQYGSLWCNRDAEAPCFCAFGVPFPDPPTNRRSPSFPLSPPPAPDRLSLLAGSRTVSRPIFSV